MLPIRPKCGQHGAEQSLSGTNVCHKSQVGALYSLRRRPPRTRALPAVRPSTSRVTNFKTMAVKFVLETLYLSYGEAACEDWLLDLTRLLGVSLVREVAERLS